MDCRMTDADFGVDSESLAEGLDAHILLCDGVCFVILLQTHACSLPICFNLGFSRLLIRYPS